MKIIFNKVLDINGKEKRYPADGKAVFFDCDDNTFYIYALYTKKDLSSSEIIQISEETYVEELAKLNSETPKIHVANYDLVKAFTLFSSIKSMTDQLTIGQLLNLDSN